jgi:curved DNA-binding protein
MAGSGQILTPMAAQFKDYYAILGVPRTAADGEIKKAFRKLAREHHPDVAKDKKKSEEKFKEINEAYEVLSDPANRRKYDELGANWKSGAEFRAPPGFGGFSNAQNYRGSRAGNHEFEFGNTGFSSFFEQLFGARGRGGPAGAPDFSNHARDVEGDILVTLEEAFHGGVRAITIQHDGRTETHQVKIPPGIQNGQKLRVSGRGQGGGDLYLNIRLASHPDFGVDGANIIHELELAPWEAALGAEITIPSLTGKVNIKIPAGSSSGTKLRLRGRGLSSRGDLLVEIKVVFPTDLTDEEKALWTALAEKSNFHPRA